MIKLQNLVFPKPGICYEQEMFFRLVPISVESRSPYAFDAQTQMLQVDKYGVVVFDTYFNGLSIGKWKNYTTVQTYSLWLEMQGAFAVTLLHSKYTNGAVIQKVLAVKKFCCQERMRVKMVFPECDAVGAIAFRVESLEDGSVLYGGGYAAEESAEEPRDVGLALNICNYNREAYIYRNIGIIQRYILDNPESELREHLSIFIADNSATIDAGRLPAGCTHVYPQGDFGSAGGFCRGLMEIQRANTDNRLTHAVMMDDDILIEPGSLERMYAFLRFVKEEYRSAFVGGALLRLDFQHIQTTHGGEWDWYGEYIFHKCNANLLSLEDTLKNEVEDGAKINAWWFHCIPLSEISQENLPYPFFFHMDDMEYDLRNCKQVIHLNGICVWHEPFEYKPGSHLCYYNTRNILITNMLHQDGMTATSAKSVLNKQFFHTLWTYRYKEAELVLRGAEDAFRGPEWLIEQDPEALLEDVLAQGYKKQMMDQLPIRLDYNQYLDAFRGGAPETKWQRRIRRWSLNGYLRKAKRDAIVPMYSPLIRTVYRAKRVMNYDPISERGFITEKSYKEFFRLLIRYLKVRRLISRQFEAVRKEYKEEFPNMTNDTFWRSYLGIAEKEGM